MNMESKDKRLKDHFWFVLKLQEMKCQLTRTTRIWIKGKTLDLFMVFP